MSAKKNTKKSSTSLTWYTKPPIDLPGMFLMKLSLKDLDNFDKHCPELDDDYKYVYTDPLACINIVNEIYTFHKNKLSLENINYKSKKKNIENKSYYLQQNERSQIFIRHNQNKKLKTIFNLEEFLKHSFDVDDEIDPDIEEEYPLFFSPSDNFIMIVGENIQFDEYHNESITSVVNKVVINNEKYNLTAQNVNTYLCIHIKNGIAYYSPINVIYKLNKF